MLSIIFSVVLLACNQTGQNKVKNQPKTITFSGLDSIQTVSKVEIEKYLKQRDFSFLNSEDEVFTWKSKNNEIYIDFNGAELFQYRSESKSEFDSLLKEIKSLKYETSYVEENELVKVMTFVKGEKILIVTTIQDEENNKSLFSINFI